MKRILALGMLAFMAASCATAVPERAVRAFDARRLVPEVWYADAFETMRECAGVSRPYADVEWYVVDAGLLGDFAGLWSPPSRIYLDERYVMNGNIIAHELLHFITERLNDDPEFLRCDPLQQHHPQSAHPNVGEIRDGYEGWTIAGRFCESKEAGRLPHLRIGGRS